jgi:hypothetical protein
VNANERRRASKAVRNAARQAANDKRRLYAAAGNVDALDGLRARLEGRRQARRMRLEFWRLHLVAEDDKTG